MVSLISAATLTLIVGSSARPNLVPDSPARSPERASMQGTRFFSSETVSAALV